MATFKLFSRRELSDEELVLKYRSDGNAELIGELYQRYTHLVFGLCMKYLKDTEKAKDAVMGIFEELMSDLQKHEIDRFNPWLHTKARNFCLMQLRKNQTQRKNHKELTESEKQLVKSERDVHPMEDDKLEGDLEALANAMDQLKPEQRQCIELFYLKRKSYNEVSEITGMDYKEVKSHIQNGKRNLRLKMESNE